MELQFGPHTVGPSPFLLKKPFFPGPSLTQCASVVSIRVLCFLQCTTFSLSWLFVIWVFFDGKELLFIHGYLLQLIAQEFESVCVLFLYVYVCFLQCTSFHLGVSSFVGFFLMVK